jgi:hypothetical protein
MNGLLPATKADTIGVLILEEFACFQAMGFIESIRQSDEIQRQHLRWRDSSTRAEDGFYTHHGQCSLIVRGTSVELHLFDLSVSLPRNFNLNDLMFPVEIGGCLVLANQEVNPATWQKDRFPGWLDWIHAQGTTYLVAVTGSDAPALPLDEFLGHLSLKPGTQVVELPSHRVVGGITDHIFDLAVAKQVLTTLVENIMVSKFSASDHSV